MNIAEPFIKRPVMTSLVMFAIMLFGAFAYRALPVSDLPNVDFPTITVSADLPGANPETMASAVAMPLERQFSTVAGVDSMTSTSSLGSTNITLQFNLDRDIDAAAQDVQAMIAKASRDLPSDMPNPPSYQKVNPADAPILYLAFTSPTMNLPDLNEYAESTVAQRISMISGVAQVSVYGSQKYAVRVQLDPKALASRQIGIDEVTHAVQSGNVNLPVGTLYGSHQAIQLKTNGQLMHAKDYAPLIVAYRNGSPVRLADLGQVIDGVENDKSANWFNGMRGMVLAIQRQPGTNTVEVVDNIRKLLPKFRKQMPAAVQFRVMYDRSVTIRDSVHDVQFTLLLTIALVIMAIFLFLRNLSATLIPSLAVPMSIVGTFAVMYQLGYSLDNLSLMALTLSVGFVVDDAIVMLENIVRHMEAGESPMQAAFGGAREIGFTIVSMTLSLAAVFIPVLFMGGIMGRLLREFAVTIACAILVSGFVSLTLTPMLCSRFLRPSKRTHHGKLYAALEFVFDAMFGFYTRTLGFVMRHRFGTMVVSAAALVATVYLLMAIPKGFLPSEDSGQIFVSTEAPQGTSFESMAEHQKQLQAIALKSPYVDNFTSLVGRGTQNQGRMMVRLKPRKDRPHVDHVIQELRREFSKVPGISAYLQNPPAIRIGGKLTKSLFQFTLQAPDTVELYAAAQKLEGKLKDVADLQDVTSDLQINNPEVNVQIDRDKASALGVTAKQIENALSTAYGSRLVSTIYAPNNTYDVIVEVEDQYQMDPQALFMLYIRSNTGQLIPLNTVATLTRGTGPLTVNHFGQLPSVTLSFNLRPGISLGQAVDEVNRVARETLPSTITTSFQGTAQAYESSFRGLGILLPATILVIYIILGILYESYIHPITILSGLPSAGFGALLMLWLFKMELNVYAFVGVIMLIGIVKKNAIMMIDFALERERQGHKSPEEAIFEGALVRFRPIMMTTMAALMGTLPIAIGYGAGGESRRPLGLAVVGGLVFSQFMTLYITPVFYTYMDRVQQWSRRMRKKDTPERLRLEKGEEILAQSQD